MSIYFRKSGWVKHSKWRCEEYIDLPAVKRQQFGVRVETTDNTYCNMFVLLSQENFRVKFCQNKIYWWWIKSLWKKGNLQCTFILPWSKAKCNGNAFLQIKVMPQQCITCNDNVIHWFLNHSIASITLHYSLWRNVNGNLMLIWWSFKALL